MIRSNSSEAAYLPVYASALAFIAILVVASHVVLDRIAGEQAISSRMTHMASEQNELAQRAARLTLEFLETAQPDNRAGVKELIRETHAAMRENHIALTRGDESRGIPSAAIESIEAIYYDEPHLLDQRLRLYMYDIREVLNRNWSPDLRDNFYVRSIIEESRHSLLGTLQDATAAFLDDSLVRVDRLRFMLKAFHGGILAGILFVGAFVFYPLFRRIHRQRQRLLKQARTDSLTGILNRRSFMKTCDAEFARVRRYGGRLSVLMMDIDNFKKLNDTYGHATGDDVIRALAAACGGKLRQSDVFARIGGEEFAALLPETDREKAAAVAEKLREMLSNISLTANDADGRPVRFTVSIGVAEYRGDRADPDLSALLHCADMRLYEAKRLGRNRVVASDGEDETDTARPPASAESPGKRLDLN